MKRSICIHGHFYQPPREDPWTGEVEKEDSAHPFHDWNERITVECYRPNMAAQILDLHGHVRKTLNNYSRISFDFGPTLLSWMEEEASDVYEAVLASDEESRTRFSGHGNAMAQAYNHMILPLADRRDKETQVIWGIKDFEYRFRRRPEGMWLPETAVDLSTLEILADRGIRFTTLAPRQAKRSRVFGDPEWTMVNEGGIDPTRAYKINLPYGKKFSLFFFQEPISRAVSFEKLLENGDRLLYRLMEVASENKETPWIMHIATDGETFGHHHKFGEMALAYVLDKIESEYSAVLTNYGEFLERNPPLQEVEILENTSWSCVHGVERWRSDCGCHVGGESNWNRAWRAPLREALDWLRRRVDPLFEREMGRYLRDPWDARNDYIEILLDASDEVRNVFFGRHAKRDLSEREKKFAISLLELERHGMIMFTSCGWFFNDLSGLETRLVLNHAGRVLDLSREILNVDLLPEFLNLLEKAKSNRPEYQDGRKIFDRFVTPRMRS